jgi:hypothetical protein
MVAAGVDPQEPYPGVREPWRCLCRMCGNEVTPRLDGVRRGHGPCRYCGTRERGAARAITPEKTEARVRQAGGEPLEPYPGGCALAVMESSGLDPLPVHDGSGAVGQARAPGWTCHGALRTDREPE